MKFKYFDLEDLTSLARLEQPMTASMHIAFKDLKLDHLFVIYPGALAYPLAERISALPLVHLGTAEFIRSFLARLDT